MLPLCWWFIHAQLFILSRCGSVSCTYFCSKISSKHTINSSIFSFSRKKVLKIRFAYCQFLLLKNKIVTLKTVCYFFRLFLLANGLCLAKNNIRPNKGLFTLRLCELYIDFLRPSIYILVCVWKKLISNTVLDFCLAKTNFGQWYHRVEILINIW